MTDAEIDDLPAGREMDALVAEKIMGWYREDTIDYTDGSLSHPGGWFNSQGYRVADLSWSPSKSIGAAWQVRDKSKIQLQVFSDGSGWAFDADELAQSQFTDSSDLPVAICRAALKSRNRER